MSEPSGEDAVPAYAIRIRPRAEQDIEEAFVRFAELTDADAARDWAEGLRVQIRRLATSPRQFSPLPEAHRFPRRVGEIRHLVYRRTANAAVYRVLFKVMDNGPDGPTVIIFHVRHASRRPLTAREAREMGGEL